MKTFREFLRESKKDRIYKENQNILVEFLEELNVYMDYHDKERLNKIYNLTKDTSLIEDIPVAYRVQCEQKEYKYKHKFISFSKEKLKGKVLHGIIEDFKHLYKVHDGIKDCKIVYLEIQNAKGISVIDIISDGLKRGSFLNEFIKENIPHIFDTFKRLKPEKEILVLNKNLQIKNKEYL